MADIPAARHCVNLPVPKTDRPVPPAGPRAALVRLAEHVEPPHLSSPLVRPGLVRVPGQSSWPEFRCSSGPACPHPAESRSQIRESAVHPCSEVARMPGIPCLDIGLHPITVEVGGGGRSATLLESASDQANRPRWRRDLNPCTRICSPLPRLSATPPGNLLPTGTGRDSLRADDGIRTRDPHLGKVMLYQLSHVRAALQPSGSGAIRNHSRG